MTRNWGRFAACATIFGCASGISSHHALQFSFLSAALQTGSKTPADKETPILRRLCDFVKHEGVPVYRVARVFVPTMWFATIFSLLESTLGNCATSCYTISAQGLVFRVRLSEFLGARQK